MTKEENEKVVLRRGMSEHDWYTPSHYLPPVSKEPFRFRVPQVELQTPTAESAERWAKRVKIAAVALVFVALGLFCLQASVKGFDAHGVSMEPTLHEGDNIVINRLAFSQLDFGILDWAPIVDTGTRWNSPSRGDIIVFKSPTEDKELVKRVIGLPGERVEIRGGVVYLGDTRLDEPYANGESTCRDQCTWTIPAGHYFVLGDNREDSRDSREGWTVPIQNIEGKKLFAY